ncbi:MAG TPA: alpha/beta hydrolase [Stellaceae bacterium]|nr:alpha/beta hydrolase [Stellaceae bacterium]
MSMTSHSMTSHRLACLGPHGFHRIAYVEWPGPPGARTVLCIHGLTRNGRDFDMLAAALSRRWRVVCPDVVGRGKSEWLAHPEDYGYPLYLSDMTALIARLDVAELDIVGTSMGGLIGMMLAAQPGSPIRRLVINDIGPLIAKEGLERIASYVGADPGFDDLAQLEAYLRQVSASFGNLTDAQWRHLAEHGARRRPDGKLGRAYDPGIAGAFATIQGDVDLWSVWDKIACPTLVLRGALSDLLRRADAEAMTARGPKARLVEFPGIGHAPALMDAEQIGVIEDFLAA